MLQGLSSGCKRLGGRPKCQSSRQPRVSAASIASFVEIV